MGRTKLLGFSLIKAPLLCATPVILGQGFLNVQQVLDMTKEFVYQCPDGRPSRRGAWLSRFRRCSGQQLLPEQKNENMHDGQKKRRAIVIKSWNPVVTENLSELLGIYCKKTFFFFLAAAL